jgi:hypothetical protein
VHNDDPEFATLFKVLGKILNLSEHTTDKQNAKKIIGPVDIEGRSLSLSLSLHFFLSSLRPSWNRWKILSL